MSSVSGINSLLSSATPAATTPTINISSLLAAAAGASTPGIDVSAAVAAALYAARAPERGWQAQQTTLAAQTAALTDMQSDTTALSNDMDSLNSLSGPLSARAVASSNPTAVTATAASGTIPGNHTVVVNNLAATGSWYSDLAASPTTALPSGAFTISTTAGASATITVGSGVNTLNDVAASINSQTALGVTATVVSDSTGARLAIVSQKSGSAADFSITSAPTTTTAWSSPSVPTSSSTLAANSFTITDGSTTSTVNVTDGETLGQLASSINTQNIGVNASVVQDANGYHMSIVSGDGTTPFTISMPSFGYTQATAGANASVSVDGIPISSATNTVTGAIGGVTLNLLNQTTGSIVNLSVGADTTQISTAINSFVTDYNSAITAVNAQYSYSGASGTQGVLSSDPTVRALQSSLLSALNYVNVPATGTTTVPTLSALGISVNQDGTLAVDGTALNNAITTNSADVQSFFQGSALNGFASSVSTQLSNFTDPSNGAFSVDLSSISNENQDLTNQINNFESSYIARQQISLTADYSAAEIALQQLPNQVTQLQTELGQNNSSGS